MWKLIVGVCVAKYTTKGKTYIARKESGLWQFQGSYYKSPLDAFIELEKGTK